MQYLYITYKSQAKKTRKTGTRAFFATPRPKASVFLGIYGIIAYGKTSELDIAEPDTEHIDITLLARTGSGLSAL